MLPILRFLFIFLLAFPIESYSQEEDTQNDAYEVYCEPTYEEMGQNQCAVIIAMGGLKIRQTPSFNGKVLGVIPFGEKVLWERPQQMNENETIMNTDSIWGNWAKVRWKKVNGYVFDAFLSTDGIMKIKDPYTLILEDAGYCSNDCYASLTRHYNYYSLLRNPDGKRPALKKFKPTFVGSHDSFEGVSINDGDPRESLFILITADEIPQNNINAIYMKETILGWPQNDENQERSEPVPPISKKVMIPGTSWILEVKNEKFTSKEEGYTYDINRLYLRDTSSGLYQKLTMDDNSNSTLELTWCGDIDQDGIMDFLIFSASGDHTAGYFLFLSKNPGKGKLVKPAGSYYFSDCC